MHITLVFVHAILFRSRLSFYTISLKLLITTLQLTWRQRFLNISQLMVSVCFSVSVYAIVLEAFLTGWLMLTTMG
jgi:hypothetical protein